MCGKQTEPDARFCGVCGAALTGGEILDGPELPRVGFGEAIRLGFGNYFNFRGRATRAEYWWWLVFILLAGTVLGITDFCMGTIASDGRGLFGTLGQLATIIPGLSLGFRRLHDINRSGWWLLLLFAIIIGWIVLIRWLIWRGDNGPNKYGPDPRTTPR